MMCLPPPWRNPTRFTRAPSYLFGVAACIRLRVYSEPKKDLFVATSHQLHSAAHVPFLRARLSWEWRKWMPEAVGSFLLRRSNYVTISGCLWGACLPGNGFSACRSRGASKRRIKKDATWGSSHDEEGKKVRDKQAYPRWLRARRV